MIDGDDDRIAAAAAAAATADAKRVDDDALHSAARWPPTVPYALSCPRVSALPVDLTL